MMSKEKVIELSSGKKIGGNNSVFIIAEIGSNHNSDLSMVKKMIDYAAKYGADAVKIQSFKAEDFVVEKGLEFEYKQNGSDNIKLSQFELFKNLEFKKEWHKEIFDYAKEKGLVIFSTPGSKEFVEYLDKEMNVELFKIGADDMTNHELIRSISETGKPLVISTGMANMSDVEDVYDMLINVKLKNISMLQCTSVYPSDYEELNLNVIKTYQNKFDAVIGFSDHSIGNYACFAAVALGAKVIEKHITLDKKLPGPDHWFSANPEELKDLVKGIRAIEKSMGSYDKYVVDKEKESYVSCHRGITCNTNLRKRDTIKEDSICLKRPFKGIHPKYLKKIIGARLLNDKSKDEPLKWEDININQDEVDL